MASRLTTPSSATGLAGAAPAWRRAKAEGRKHGPCALLAFRDRVIRVKIPKASVHRRVWRKVMAEPKTIGEHLRKKRVDMGMTNVQVAHSLGVCYQTMERCEHGRFPMKPKHRAKVVAFLATTRTQRSQTQAPDGHAGNLWVGFPLLAQSKSGIPFRKSRFSRKNCLVEITPRPSPSGEPRGRHVPSVASRSAGRTPFARSARNAPTGGNTGPCARTCRA